MDNSLRVRPATKKDHQEIANLMFFERHVHRHLDWRHPTEWLGAPFYWALERNSRILAVLACPQDQQETAWVRLFVHSGQLSEQESWKILWDYAKKEISRYGDVKVVAISLQNWMKTLLQENGFRNDEQIVMMIWEEKTPLNWQLPKGVSIRAMKEADLPAVARVDEAAFTPIWQNSLSMLKQAYPQAVVATVAESAEGIIGYQLSTSSPFGAHMARLASHPKAQRQGIASALIGDLTTKLLAKNISQLSVNTQSNNLRSLALYKKCGFQETGEEYPLYTFEISGNMTENEEVQWDTVKMPLS